MATNNDPILQRGQEILNLLGEDSGSIFNKDWWYGQIMDWSMKNETFKIQMFRFVDVLPYLNSSDEVARHLREYFSGDNQDVPPILGFGLGLGSLAPGLMASAIKKNVTQMAKMFITGANGDEAIKVLLKMRQNKICFTVDILGEAAVSEAEAWDYQRRYMDLIETLSREAANWPEIPLIDRDHLGPISKVNVSVKISSLYSQFDPITPEGTLTAIKEKLRPILRRAKELGAFVNLDMESYFHKDVTLRLFTSLLEESEFKDHNNVGIVIQAYLRDSEKDLRQLIEWAKKRTGRITVRLVKGAYWDYETVNAQQKGWPIPVYTVKAESDANYENLTRILLENDRYIKAAFGSHNVRSVAHALVTAEKLGVDPRSFEIQMLYGMGASIKSALTKMGLRVREYAPVGELIPGMAYLVRRLLENTSNESFLRAKFSSHVSTEELMRDPRQLINGKASSDMPQLKGFVNEAPLDFNLETNRSQMTQALSELRRSKLGKTYPVVIGKKSVKTPEVIQSVNPANPKEVVGMVHLAGVEEAEQALSAATEAQKTWGSTSFEHRAQLLEKVAEILTRRKFEISALEVLEVGKTWREADGDVAEAIDFCRYYARQGRQLSTAQRCSFVPGEDSQYHYQPRGVGVVIAPWNFPLAILCGMTVGALVCGNSVIMKPAEQSSVIAAWFMDVLTEAGFPPGVVNFLPGRGEIVGEHLVNHKLTDFIVFTGSKEVGLHIMSRAAMRAAGQRSVKKVVAELGGKNAIIIDSDADMDEAVLGTLYSAFGFQGQKCSACSRLIVVEENYDRFVARLIEGARSLTMGQPEHPGTAIGPVIDDQAYKKIMDMIEVGKSEAKLAYQAQAPSQGYFVPPTIFVDVKPTSRIAQEEIFGPVLAVIKAKDFNEALKIANGTEFALTGGVYSRSPAHIEKAKKEFEVGNLYINRGITGALVGRHPFGGFKMSGMGSKAGGPDYLTQFLEPRTVTENTMRRGFAPSQD
ncbi:MAG: L-glutamate gamma-semialdehyde dehydrogenase [Oligoflexia bacterium]|nr:L-glutamate gamma-semialdehyde dehydrogenase [Oligoflexia bacterium]